MSYRWGDFYSHESESFEAETALAEAKPDGARGAPDLAVIVRGSPQGAGARVAKRLKRNRLVAEVEDTILASRNGRSSYVIAWLKHKELQGVAAARVAEELAEPGVVVGGTSLTTLEFREQTAVDLRRAQLIAFPLLLLLGLWVFRSLVAALVPVALGGFALLTALGALRLISELVPLSVFSLDLALALALGLGVDYSLLMVSRFRESLAEGRTAAESAARTLRTAGRTIAFSSVAIAASFAALLVVPMPFVRSIAVGGCLVAAITGFTAVVLLPALLTISGHRINALAPNSWQRSVKRASRSRDRGFWYRVAQMATGHPYAVALLAGMALILLTLPALSMRSIGLDQTSLPPSSDARKFAETARREFENPLLGELAIAVHGDEQQVFAVWGRVNNLAESTGLGTPLSVGFKHSADLFQIRLNPTHPVFSEKSQRLVTRLRHMNAPIAVAGETAAYMDSVTTLENRLPLALAIVIASSILFVFLATGSLVLAVKTLIMNALSLGAALGLVVFVFQEGRLEQVLGYSSQGAIIVALPLVMVAAAAGLLTDYGLFLLTRIREEREKGFSDRKAIALGLERTGRVITAAALLFAVAVGAFSTSGLLLLKVSSIAIVLTVLLDAFVVRPLLVPSLMTILGRWNWWPRRMPGDTRS